MRSSKEIMEDIEKSLVQLDKANTAVKVIKDFSVGEGVYIRYEQAFDRFKQLVDELKEAETTT